MPNRPICAEDALLSETPMPPEQILRYLDRIGLRDAVPPPPTLETLRRLQSAHLLYVPYENLDLLRGAITSLEHGALFEKIVEKRRGGLCFELNGLFCWLLCSLGYQVTSYAGRFIYPSEAGIQMRRHRVLVVTLEGKRYLTETGMNSEGPRAPLVLAESEAQWDGVTEYRFSRDAFWGWVLWKRSPGGAGAGCMALPRNRSSTSTLLCPAFFATCIRCRLSTKRCGPLFFYRMLICHCATAS